MWKRLSVFEKVKTSQVYRDSGARQGERQESNHAPGDDRNLLKMQLEAIEEFYTVQILYQHNVFRRLRWIPHGEKIAGLLHWSPSITRKETSEEAGTRERW
jgi:hypothetical protein